MDVQRCTCVVESELICHKLVELTSLTGGYNGYIGYIYEWMGFNGVIGCNWNIWG